MKIGTIGKIVGGVVVLGVGVVVAGFAILANMDFNSYKPMVTAEVKKATGRDLVIEGDLRLEIGFSPSIAVDGVRFQNAAWSEDADMVSVDRFEAKVNLLPLLSSTIDVERLILTGARIVLERNADGAFNFEFAETGSEQPAAAPSEPSAPGGGSGGLTLPVVRLVEIRDSRVIYRDAVGGQNRDAVIERLILAGEGVSDPLDLDFQGAVDGLEIGFGGKLGAPTEMLEPTRPWPIDLGGALAGATWALNGSIAEPTTARGIDLTFKVEGSQLGDLSQVAALASPGATVPALGPYSVSATVTGNADGALALSGIAVTIGSPSIVQANVTGDIADLINAAGLDLAVAVNGESLANASEAAGTALPPIGPIEMAGTVTGSLAQQIVMEGFTVKIGGSDMAGTVRVSTAGGKPYVAADLRSTLFDLADVAPASDSGAAGGGGSGGTTQAASPSDGRAIPDMPLPVDGLKAVDADVKLAVSTFNGPSGLTAEDIAITLALKNGDLRVDPIGLVLGGGTVAGSARLNAAAATPALTTSLAIDKLDVGLLLAEMGVTDLVYGTINTDLSLTGAGGNLRGLLASLNGKSTVLMGEGRIKSEALDTWIGGATAILTKLVAGNRPEYTLVNCFVNVIDFNGGVGTVSTGLFDIEYATITAAGDFNLGTEGLNLTIDPQPKSATINTAVPVKIGGTFLQPTYALDPAATARKAIGILGAIAFPPAAIVGLGELGTGDDNPCLTQGQGGGSTGGSQAPAPAAPAAPSNPVDAIQQGVGGALRGLLGGGN